MTLLVDAEGALLGTSGGLLGALGYKPADRTWLTLAHLIDQLQPGVSLADLSPSLASTTVPTRRRLRLVTRRGGRLWADVEFTAMARDGGIVHQVIVELGNRRRTGAPASMTRLVEAMTRSQTLGTDSDDAPSVFGNLLDEFLDLTDSGFGFIGEVLSADGGAPYLHMHVLTTRAPGVSGSAPAARVEAHGSVPHNLDGLVEACLRERAPLVVNVPAADPRADGIKGGGASPVTFLGLPIQHAGRLVGIVGLANREGGYDEAVADYLYPLAAVAANVIDALHVRARQRTAEAALDDERERLGRSERLLAGIVNAAGEAVIVSDLAGRIVSFNPAAEQMFGRTQASVIGRPVEILIPRADRARHAQYLRTWSHLPSRKATGRWRRETAMRANGDSFPIEIFNTVVERADDQLLVALIRDLTEHLKVQAMKDDFVSMVSHELRTPLTSIQGALGLVVGGVTGEITPQARQLLEVASANSSRLVRLTSDLLDLQMIEAGRMTYRLVEADLVEIARSTLLQIAPLALTRSVSLVLAEPQAAVPAMVDPDRIAQVLVNLVANALAVSSQGSTVSVAVVDEGAMAGLDITDRGPGIAPADQDRIWGTFVRGASGTPAAGRGAGIGLPIARALVLGHGGTLDFTTAMGVGTTFRVRIPRHHPHA